MPISIEADPTLAQGYLKVNGVTAATVTSTGITASSLVQKYTLATAQASTSGTSIDFTGIPSWAKRITVMFNGVSTNGTAQIQIQVGSGSIQSSGYASSVLNQAGTPASSTSAMLVGENNSATATHTGIAAISLIGSNAWVMSSLLINTNGTNAAYSSGSVTLSGALDRVRITTVNGTDTFDAGTINISYEG